MSDFTATEPSRTLGTIVKDLTADLSMLFRTEVELLKLELRHTFAKLGAGGAMMAGALVLALVGLAFLFVTITLGLVALGVPAWLSALVVTLALFTGAAILVLLARKQFRGANLMPNDSIEQIRSDIDAIRADVQRVRSR